MTTPVVYVNGQRLIAGEEHDYLWIPGPPGWVGHIPVFEFDLKGWPGPGDKIVIVDGHGNENLFEPQDLPKPCTGFYCRKGNEPKGWGNCIDSICDWCKWQNANDELTRLRKSAGELGERKIFLEMVKQQASASPEALKEFHKLIRFQDSFDSIVTQHDDQTKSVLEQIAKVEESLTSKTKPKDPRE